jgi:hypothetical protein
MKPMIGADEKKVRQQIDDLGFDEDTSCKITQFCGGARAKSITFNHNENALIFKVDLDGFLDFMLSHRMYIKVTTGAYLVGLFALICGIMFIPVIF